VVFHLDLLILTSPTGGASADVPEAPVQIGRAGRLSSGFDEREQAISNLVDIDRLFNGRHFDSEFIFMCSHCSKRALSLRLAKRWQFEVL
jgi:hypothetical protein